MRIQPRIFQELDRDMIFIRGDVEVYYSDDGSIVNDKKMDDKERLSFP